MKRALLLLTLPLLVACASSKPPAPPVDPVTDPTIIGAVNDAAVQGSVEAAEGAAAGRRIGRVAGVIAAVFGGPSSETIDQTIDRYRRTRDGFEAAGAVIGGAHGAQEGAKRGFEVDQRFAQLHELKGVQVFRPYPDQIDAYVEDRALIADVRSVFAGRPGWTIEEDAASRPDRIILHINYLG